MSTGELKRQAKSGNPKAKKVYAVRGTYGVHIFTLIWSLIGVLTAAMIVLLEHGLWSGLAIAIAVPITVIVHAVLPWSRYPSPSLGMAAFASPVLSKVLRVLTPILRPLEKLLGKWVARSEIQHIHSNEELIEIISTADLNSDPVGKDELEIAMHALTFGHKKITEIMTPLSVVKTVRRDDVLSPVLLGELHDSGFSRFPVVEPEQGNIVGMLYHKDLVEIHANKTVGAAMRSELFYVNEFTSLDNVLNAFLRTKHHLFLVVNEFEEIVGVVAIEDVLEQIIGRKIIDEFDAYDDLREVARQRAHQRADAREGTTLHD